MPTDRECAAGKCVDGFRCAVSNEHGAPVCNGVDDMRPISSSIDRRSAGFSLLELLVAMAVFMVIGGAAMQAFRVHVPLFTAQQNQSALNFTLRNAAAQMQ